MIDLPIMGNHQSPPPSPPPDSILKRDALELLAQPQAAARAGAHPGSRSAAGAGDHPPGSAGQPRAGSRAPAGLPHAPRPTPAQQPAQMGEAHGLGPLSSGP